MRHSDTSPEVHRLQIERLRKMTGEERIRIAFKLSNFMRRSAASRIRTEHPDWTERQVKRELVRVSFLPEPLPPGA
ncbi:MAG TPA: hypothetical protein VLK66_18620 [Longimicrobium sp.]|nr:hypothetical protein [Longimicrobium sp.]